MFFIPIENVLGSFNVYFHFKNVLEHGYPIHGDPYGMVNEFSRSSFLYYNIVNKII